MEYKNLIKRLRAHKIKTDLGRFSPEICREAADAIEALLEVQAAQEWISVEERFPEDKAINEYSKSSRPVLAIGEEGTMFVARHVIEIDEGDEIGYWDDEGDAYGHIYVTHWMPLPEPPKN